MRRGDRLIELIQILRDGRIHRADDLAARLDVSVRTAYRDMTTLMASGIPVTGTPGMGYALAAPITLPPLNLSLTELEALHLGLAVVGESADEELKGAAASLSAKIDAVLPEDRSGRPTGWGFAVYPFADASGGFQHLALIRGAIRARQKVRVSYSDLEENVTKRVIRPLKLEYWGRVWTCAAWCELTGTFQVFRVDRMAEVDVLPELFVEEQGKSLADYAEALRSA